MKALRPTRGTAPEKKKAEKKKPAAAATPERRTPAAARNARARTREPRRPAAEPTSRRAPARDGRPQRPAPRTSPTARPVEVPARAKSASQAKARAKARKAKAPKVVRPPLRERLLIRLASMDLSPRRMVARVPFVVLVIAALGLGLGVTLWLSTDAAERSYQLGKARQVNQALSQQKEALERDVLEAQAAPALAEAARNLGMIPSRDTAHLVQDPTGTWVVVGTPKPAEGVPPPPLNAPLPDPVPPPPAPRPVDTREVPVRMPTAAEVPHVLTPGAPQGLGPVPAVPSAPVIAPPAAPVDPAQMHLAPGVTTLPGEPQPAPGPAPAAPVPGAPA